MSVYHMCVWDPQRPEELELQMTVSCRVGARTQTPIPLQKQPVLLTTKLSLQAFFFLIFFILCVCLHVPQCYFVEVEEEWGFAGVRFFISPLQSCQGSNSGFQACE